MKVFSPLVDDVLNVVLALFRLEIEVALKAEPLVRACLNLCPDIFIRHVILGEEAAVGDVVEPIYRHACALDEPLNHIHALHVRALLVHNVHIIRAVFGEVLFGHLPDDVRLVNDIVFSEALVTAINRVVGSHNDATDEVLIFVLHGIEHRPSVRLEDLEVLRDGWVIHERNANYPAVLIESGVKNRYVIYCCYHN